MKGVLSNLGVLEKEPFASFFNQQSFNYRWIDYVFAVFLFDITLNWKQSKPDFYFKRGYQRFNAPEIIKKKIIDFFDVLDVSEDKKQSIRGQFVRESSVLRNLLFHGAAENRSVSANAESGIKYIHRIWLGKTPSEEIIRSICASNIEISNRWVGVSATVSILWTNNLTLLNGGLKTPGVIVKNYRELFINEASEIGDLSKIYFYCDSLIYKNQLAFATDILRLLALKKYGGLYLDFEFISPALLYSNGRVYLHPARDITQQKFHIPKNATRATGIKKSDYFPMDMLSTGGGVSIPKSSSDSFLTSMIENTLLCTDRRNSVFIDHALKFILDFLRTGITNKFIGFDGLLHASDAFSYDFHHLLDIYPLFYAMLNCGMLSHIKINMIERSDSRYEHYESIRNTVFGSLYSGSYALIATLDMTENTMVIKDDCAVDPYAKSGAHLRSHYHPVLHAYKSTSGSWAKVQDKPYEI
ncbi:TcdA/TcdB catalytic glycosyltransferase domain-containing protein [Pelagibaculum spongiae]|nr:TcdA/TcdB catalytic glycosyltransferase domain-containing protein [Pelagibaculum spongiae]